MKRVLTIDNPFTLSETLSRPLSDDNAIDAKLDAAREGARELGGMSIAERASLCTRAVEAMLASRQSIAEDITRMVGKPIAQAAKEVDAMADRARHMIAIAEASLAPIELPERKGFIARIQRVPLGVVFNMPAWNYPLLTCVNAVVPAVLAGNAVLLKHSSRSVLCGEHFAEAFAAASGSQKVLASVVCDHAAAARIAGDRRVNFVAFTGSVAGGHAVYRAVAEGSFNDVGLELGGKDAAYVAADADIAATAAGLVDGACYNAGQSCCAVERVYVDERVHDALVEACLAHMKSLKLGDPQDAATEMGPMAQPGATAALNEQVAQAEAEGAQALCGGAPLQIDDKGRFFGPTLLVRTKQSMAVMRQESFGPLLPIMATRSDEQALALMNDSDLGLTGSIWTTDPERAMRMADSLEVGTVYMNQCDSLDPALPWSGVKDTGKGATLSALGFLHLSRPRALNFKLDSKG